MSLWFPFAVRRRPRPLPSHCEACLKQVQANAEALEKLGTAYNTLRQRVYRDGKEAEVALDNPGGEGQPPAAYQPRAGDRPPQ